MPRKRKTCEFHRESVSMGGGPDGKTETRHESHKCWHNAAYEAEYNDGLITTKVKICGRCLRDNAKDIKFSRKLRKSEMYA